MLLEKVCGRRCEKEHASNSQASGRLHPILQKARAPSGSAKVQRNRERAQQTLSTVAFQCGGSCDAAVLLHDDVGSRPLVFDSGIRKPAFVQEFPDSLEISGGSRFDLETLFPGVIFDASSNRIARRTISSELHLRGNPGRSSGILDGPMQSADVSGKDGAFFFIAKRNDGIDFLRIDG
jgi:hypothetical protein